MIYKKIENYFGELTNDEDFPMVFGVILLMILTPIWLPFWIISKFINTSNK